MDPNITYSELITAYKAGDTDTAYDCARDLRTWLNSGGFYPTNAHWSEVEAILEHLLTMSVNRSTY